ncbi:hypothetical protein [Embleya sp. NBC_00896]|uniref:hypothetical protein n=1 Tax=Embleya sp. NBC_00896 TaxID=2975961 RepID=UPI002F90CA25|nr:hypothetical protein OG928_40090 [Embleya sp. NBC_00896]
MAAERTLAGEWTDTMLDAGRLPMTLAFAALLVTFLVTRMITRMIRAGRGPFRNMDTGGVHIHHVVPGVVLTLVGGFLGIGAGEHLVLRSIAGVVLGVGAGLVLDEFAMIVHLDDVYWSEQGRVSIEATVLAIAAVGLAASGFVPFEASPEGDTVDDRIGWLIALLVDVAVAAITFAKGKFRIGVIGIFIPIVNVVAAIRLARPGSPWAHRYYRDKPGKLHRATLRAARHDARWDPLRRRFEDVIGGRLAPLSAPPPDPRPRSRPRPRVTGTHHTLTRAPAGPR